MWLMLCTNQRNIQLKTDQKAFSTIQVHKQGHNSCWTKPPVRMENAKTQHSKIDCRLRIIVLVHILGVLTAAQAPPPYGEGPKIPKDLLSVIPVDCMRNYTIQAGQWP